MNVLKFVETELSLLIPAMMETWLMETVVHRPVKFNQIIAAFMDLKLMLPYVFITKGIKLLSILSIKLSVKIRVSLSLILPLYSVK